MKTTDTISLLGEHYDEMYADVSRIAEQEPYALIGAATAVGFILGGGMRSRLMGSLISLGSRTLLTHLAGAWLAKKYTTPEESPVH